MNMQELLNADSAERRFYFAINDLAELIECGEVDFYLVALNLQRSLKKKKDPLLSLTLDRLSAVVAESSYYS